MENEVPLTCSHDPATDPYTESDESSIRKLYFSSILSRLPSGLFAPGFPGKTLCHIII
jgi:hypothetical protein